MRSGRFRSASEPRPAGAGRIRGTVFLAALACALAASALLSLRAGSYDTPLAELVRGVFGRAADERVNIVVLNNRLPRILTAVFAGAGLGASGCVLQAILRNPLASASTLGVSQGASFGAAFAIIALGLGGAGEAGVPLFAFAGSMAVALAILALSRLRQISPEGDRAFRRGDQLDVHRRDDASAILRRRRRAAIADVLDVWQPRQHELGGRARAGRGGSRWPARTFSSAAGTTTRCSAARRRRRAWGSTCGG